MKSYVAVALMVAILSYVGCALKSSLAIERSPIHRLEAKTQDGQKIVGFYRIPLGKGPSPAIVFIHGGPGRPKTDLQWLQDRLTNLPTQKTFFSLGYVCVEADFRYYQSNTKERGPILDCLAIVEEVRKLPSVDSESVVVYGGSHGGSIALELAGITKLAAVVAGEPGAIVFAGLVDEYKKRLTYKEKLTLITQEPITTDLRRKMQKRFRSVPWVEYYTAELKKKTQEKIKRISCPLMILHSDRHFLKNVNNKILIPELKAAGIKFEYKLYPGLEHGFYFGRENKIDREAFEQMVSDVDLFMKKHIKTQPKPR